MFQITSLKLQCLKAIIVSLFLQAWEGKTVCNVCFKTSLLKLRMDFQLNKCFEMPSRQTSKVVMPMSSFRTCLGGARQTNWRELIQRHELVQRHKIANIFTDSQSRHVLFRANKYLNFTCKVPFASCIKGEKMIGGEKEVTKKNLRKVSLCMECTCPLVLKQVTKPAKCGGKEMKNRSKEVFSKCNRNFEDCRCKKGFTECELKGSDSGRCTLCVDEELKHLRKSKCRKKVTLDLNASKFGPVSNNGGDTTDHSLRSSDNFIFENNPAQDGVNFPENDNVNFDVTEENRATEEKEEKHIDESDEEEDSDIRGAIKEMNTSLNITMMSGFGGLLLVIVIIAATSLMIVRRRRRGRNENVEPRENSWYFDIVPSRHKKGDSAHSTVTRTIIE